MFRTIIQAHGLLTEKHEVSSTSNSGTSSDIDEMKAELPSSGKEVINMAFFLYSKATAGEEQSLNLRKAVAGRLALRLVAVVVRRQALAEVGLHEVRKVAEVAPKHRVLAETIGT